MQSNDDGQNPAALVAIQEVKVEETVDAEVTKIADFGAFVKFANGKKGLIHISQVADSYVKNVNDHLKVGDKIKAKIIKISPDGKIDLTLKTRKEAPSRPKERHRRFDEGGSRHEKMTSSSNDKPFRTANFEDKLKQFLKESEEVQANLKKHIEEKQSRRKF